MSKILLIALLFSVGFSKRTITDEPNPMKGVMTKTEFEYSLDEKFGEFKGILEKKFIYKYDTNGNMVEESKYDSEGKSEGKFIYKYDTNGNMVEGSKYDSDEKLEVKQLYKYDNNGNMVEGSKYDSDEKLEV
ncbi:uncharacterized protein METZ01_LOCUS459189, partial [marine metagenome]